MSKRYNLLDTIQKSLSQIDSVLYENDSAPVVGLLDKVFPICYSEDEIDKYLERENGLHYDIYDVACMGDCGDVDCRTDQLDIVLNLFYTEHRYETGPSFYYDEGRIIEVEYCSTEQYKDALKYKSMFYQGFAD